MTALHHPTEEVDMSVTTVFQLPATFTASRPARLIVAALAAVILAAATGARAEASAPAPGAPLATTGSTPSAPTIVDPRTGETLQVKVFPKRFTSEKAATKQSKRLALRMVQRTGWWSWGWRAVKCGAGAFGGYWTSFWLPPWVRAGMMISGCIVAQ